MQLYIYDIREMTETKYAEWYCMMDDARKNSVDSYRFYDDRKRTVAGEMLARKAVSEICNIPPESIKIRRTKHGKPYAENATTQFNISHSEDLVICAADKKPVGIDIEKIRPVNLRIAKRIFSENEINILFGHQPEDIEFTETTDAELLLRFFELWTKKEAMGKCVGKGLLHEENHNNYTIETFRTHEDYIVSVCQKK